MLLLLLLLLHNERGAADVAAAALAAIRAPQPQTAARPSREKPHMIEALKIPRGFHFEHPWKV
jgi:hypothetical protein